MADEELHNEELQHEEVLAARTTHDGEYPIQIHEFNYQGDIEYVRVRFQGEVKRLLLHYTRYPKGESPYNQEIKNTPYIIIKNDVYELATFKSISFDPDEIG